MRKQNGATIVEVLISIIIIAIVMALLFNMFLQVRSEDISNQIQSNFTINQSTIIKEVEEDIVNYGVKTISSCNISDANINMSSIVSGYQNQFRCLKIEYAADYIQDKIAFLMLYNTYSRYDVENKEYKGKEGFERWMIQYVRGSYHNEFNLPDTDTWKNATQIMKEYPTEVITSDNIVVNYSATSTINAASIVLPIVNGEGEHYDIFLSFTFNGYDNFKCLVKDNSSFECNCLGGKDDLYCQKTFDEYA